MQAVDVEVLGAVRRWLEAGERCWLNTIVKTYGSSPRPVGSVMACNARGEIAGSLSGGCVEDELIEQLQAGRLASDAPRLLRYGLKAEDTERLGLPCGGSLHVVCEPLAPGAGVEASFRHVLERLERRECVTRIVDVATGGMRVEDADSHQALALDESDPDRPQLRHTYGPRHQLFLIGAGMVSSYLAEMAQALDYQVTVCDPRAHMLEQWAVAGVRTLVMMADDAVREYANDPMTAIVALTHDPRIDDMAMMEALTTDAFYVGAMGSERTSAKRRERLAALDLTEEQIGRLHAPVGLPIGSKTPPEIAVAILAELTAVRKARADAVRERLLDSEAVA